MGTLPPSTPPPVLGRAFRAGFAGLALLALAACGSSSSPRVDIPAPVATSLTASSATPLYGGTFTLTPIYSAGTGTLSNGVTCPASGVPSAVQFANWTGTRTYTLTVTNTANATATTTATVTPQTVVVAAISPALATVTAGGSQAFTSSVTGAADATLIWQVDGTTGGSTAAGTITTAGVYTTTYGTTAGNHTIAAVSNADGTTKQTAVVTVNAVAAPVATSLVPSTATPLYGATFTLTPTYAAGTGALDNGITCPASGTATVAVTANWTGARVYTLTVTNAAGVSATTTATVTPQTVAVGAVTPATPTLSAGGTQTFASSVTGALDSVITWSVDGVAGGSATVGTITSAGVYTAPATAGTHTVTATAHANGTALQSTLVTVVAVPVATSLAPSTATPQYGGTFTLTPTYAGGTGSLDNGVTCPASGAASAAITASWTGARVFTLTVTNAAGRTATTTATVTPQTVVVGAVTPATPTLSAGGTQTFASSVTGALDTVITWSVDGVAGGNATAGTVTSAGLYTAPAAAGTHTVSATAHANGTTLQSTLVTVVALPVATSLTASTQTPLYGATFSLTPTYANGTGTLNNGVTCPASGAASSAVTANWTGARVYTLTVTNAASATANASVTVTPQTVAVGAVSPATAYADANHTATFTSSVSGASDTAITWSVDGVAGGNATVGTISGGIYTAGSLLGDHTITATAHADGATARTATVTTVALPTATSLAASSTTPLYGATYTLTPTYSGGTGAIDNGVTCPASGSASAAITANVTSLTTYTLTVTNAAGSTATASTGVTPQTVAVGAVSPATATLTSGDSQTFAATVTGAANTTVDWSVDGVAGGTAAKGFITSGGAYTAGTAPGSYTITATAQANGTTQQTAAVTVVAAPSITSFTAAQGTFTPSATGATVTGVFANGTGLLTGGGLSQAVTSGQVVTVNPAASTTYTLTVTNAGLTATQSSATVFVGSLSMLAGVPAGLGNIDGYDKAAVVADSAKTLARFWEINGMAQDGSGNLYVSDFNNNVIRRIDAITGQVTTPYGQVGLPGTTDAIGNSAKFWGPSALVISGSTMYVADTWNDLIRVVDLGSNAVTTLVHAGPFSFQHGNIPVGMALYGTDLYVSDHRNNRIQVVDTTATDAVTPLVTTGLPLNLPVGLVFIGTDLYVADMGSNRILKVDAASDVTALASGLHSPVGLAANLPGTLLYATDYETSQVNTITLGGAVTPVAGTSGVIGSTDGASAKFAYPTALCLGTGRFAGLLVSDFGNNTLRSMDTGSYVVGTLAGVAGQPGSTNGTGTAANFQNPTGVVVDAAGTYAYVADLDNGAIRKVEIATGVTTRLADATAMGVTGFRPWSLALNGNLLYIADYGAGKVETLNLDTLAPTVIADLLGADAAGSSRPTGIAVDATGTYVYVSDQAEHLLTRIATADLSRTVIGTKNAAGYDGTHFNTPAGLAISGTTLYIADQGNSAIRKLDTGTLAISTHAGPTTFGHPGQLDGDLATATFNNPMGLALDGAGTLYVVDAYSDTVRMITAAGQVTTVAGLAGPSNRLTGQMANITTGATVALPATLAFPKGIAALPSFTAGAPGLFIAIPDGVLKVTF